MELLHLSEQSDRPLTFDQNVKENLFKVNFKVFSLAFNISAESTGKQLYCNSERGSLISFVMQLIHQSINIQLLH